MAGTPAKILLAGVDEIFLSAVARTLKQEGRESISVTTVKEAQRTLASFELEVALIDTEGLDRAGTHLMQVVVQKQPAVIPIFITNEPTPDQALIALEAGVARLLVRPVKLRDVAKAVRDTLRERNHRARRRLSRVVAERFSDAESHRSQILVIETSGPGTSEIATKLRMIGCKIKSASCGQEALHLLDEYAFDAHLLPEDTGDMLATDAVLRARTVDPDTANIVFGEPPTVEQIKTFIHFNVDSYLIRPLEYIDSAVENILYQCRTTQVRRVAPSYEALLTFADKIVTTSYNIQGGKAPKVQGFSKKFFVDDTLDLPDLYTSDDKDEPDLISSDQRINEFTPPKASFRPIVNFQAFLSDVSTRREVVPPVDIRKEVEDLNNVPSVEVEIEVDQAVESLREGRSPVDTVTHSQVSDSSDPYQQPALDIQIEDLENEQQMDIDAVLAPEEMMLGSIQLNQGDEKTDPQLVPLRVHIDDDEDTEFVVPFDVSGSKSQIEIEYDMPGSSVTPNLVAEISIPLMEPLAVVPSPESISGKITSDDENKPKPIDYFQEPSLDDIEVEISSSISQVTVGPEIEIRIEPFITLGKKLEPELGPSDSPAIDLGPVLEVVSDDLLQHDESIDDFVPKSRTAIPAPLPPQREMLNDLLPDAREEEKDKYHQENRHDKHDREHPWDQVLERKRISSIPVMFPMQSHNSSESLGNIEDRNLTSWDIDVDLSDDDEG